MRYSWVRWIHLKTNSCEKNNKSPYLASTTSIYSNDGRITRRKINLYRAKLACVLVVYFTFKYVQIIALSVNHFKIYVYFEPAALLPRARHSSPSFQGFANIRALAAFNQPLLFHCYSCHSYLLLLYIPPGFTNNPHICPLSHVEAFILPN